WLQRYPAIPLLNAYGPTKCSDDVTHHPIYTSPVSTTRTMPIGKPIENIQVYVLDQYLEPVPIGVRGELYVGGIGVGRGYLHEAERTAVVFLPDPFSREPGQRLYRTGDLVRFLPDGSIEYLGRQDQQIKIRGYRIELGEIESKLAQYPGVQQYVVVSNMPSRQ